MENRLLLLLTAVLGLLTSISVPAPAAARHFAPAQDNLDALWADLYGEEPAASIAVLKLYKNPDAAVPFLKEKLPPLRLDADECRRLLKDLGSKDEKVWKPARETLDYLDPRLAIELEKLMEEVTENPARSRMVELCSERPADSLDGKDVSLRAVGADGFNFFDGRGSWWAEHRIERIGASSWTRKMAWTRAARAIAILEQINTPDSVSILKRLALGNPDAQPTKAARASLKRLAAL